VGASGGLFLMKFGWGGVISAVSILILLAAACAMMVEKVKIVK
jgi:YNFM family putative membrane transporter